MSTKLSVPVEEFLSRPLRRSLMLIMACCCTCIAIRVWRSHGVGSARAHARCAQNTALVRVREWQKSARRRRQQQNETATHEQRARDERKSVRALLPAGVATRPGRLLVLGCGWVGGRATPRHAMPGLIDDERERACVLEIRATFRASAFFWLHHGPPRAPPCTAVFRGRLMLLGAWAAGRRQRHIPWLYRACRGCCGGPKPTSRRPRHYLSCCTYCTRIVPRGPGRVACKRRERKKKKKRCRGPHRVCAPSWFWPSAVL